MFYGENLLHFQVDGDVPVTVREGFFALDSQWTAPAQLVTVQPAQVS